MNEQSGITRLIQSIQTPKPTSVYDVYSPQRSQQLAINQQRIEQNNMRLEEQRRQQEQDKALREDLADYYDTVGYIDTPDQSQEQLNRSVYQNQLGLAEVYKQNGQADKAVTIANNAIKLRMDLEKRDATEDRQALTDLISATHTRNQGVVDLARSIHGDVYDKFNAPAVQVQERSTGKGKEGEKTLKDPEGNLYSEKDVNSVHKLILRKAEQKEKSTEGLPGQGYQVPFSAYDAKKFAGLVKQLGTEGAASAILNPPGNNPMQEIGAPAGKNVVVIRRKQ